MSSTPTSDTVCEACTAGTFSTGGTAECTKCQEGFYSSSPGASTCYTCGPGKHTNLEQTDCLSCPAGKISGVASSECTMCETGKYAEGEGNVECSFCDTEEVLKGSMWGGRWGGRGGGWA